MIIRNGQPPNKDSKNTGRNFICFLTLVFVALKIYHIVDWSWWWVFAPIWLSIAYFIVLSVILGIVLKKHHK